MKDRKHFFDYIVTTLRSTGGRCGANQPVTASGAARAVDAADWMLGARSRQMRSRRTVIEWPPLEEWPTTHEWTERGLAVSRSSLSHVSMALRALHDWMPLAVETPAEKALLASRMPQLITFAGGGDIAATPEHAELLRHLDRLMRPILAATQVQKLQWGVHLFVDDDENVTVLDPTYDIDWSNRLTTWTTCDTIVADAVRDCWAATTVAAPKACVFGTAQGRVANIESVIEWLESEGLHRPRRRRYDMHFKRACHAAQAGKNREEES